MIIRRRTILALAAFGPLVSLSHAAMANETYPSSPITILVPFDPGSGSDVYARHFGARLSEKIAQPVIVENRPGAAGALAVQALLQTEADGHTILLGSNSPMAVNVSAFQTLPYDPIGDLEPISGLTRSMAMIVVPPDSAMNSLEDLVEQGRESTLNMGTYSPGYQLSVASLLQEADFTWQDITYRGLAQTTTDVMGGQVDVGVIDSAGGVEYVRSGQIRALAVTGEERHPELPDVPTLVELGYERAVHYSWTALWAQAGTPQEIIDKLSEELLDALADPDSQQFVASTGAEVMAFDPEEMRAFQQQEIERFSEAVEILDFERM